MLFIFFWKFSPSVGYIERSYLIDERGFTGPTFGIILSIGGITFLISILFYRWMVRTFRRIQWQLLSGRQLQRVLWLYQRLGGKKDQTASDVCQKTPWLRLEQVE